MTLDGAAFWAIAVYTLAAASFVVTARNLFRCAMALAATLIGVAGLYLLMDAQFLSAVQISVYVGGVVVLVVFAVLMVEDVAQKVYLRAPLAGRAVAFGIAGLLLALVAGAMRAQGFGPARPEPAAAQAHDIGRALLSAGPGGFVVPFEVISVVLIAALIGAVTVAGRSGDDEGGPGGKG